MHCVVTSPPYFGQRDYGVDSQIGQEPTLEEYVAELVGVFTEVRRVLRPDGTVWLNLGDSYAGARGGGQGQNGQMADRTACMNGIRERNEDRLPPGFKPKDLMMIPARVALALHAAGWWLRQDIIWAKPNPMPESVRDRCTKAHEYVFLLAKAERYYFDAAAIAEASSDNSHGALKGDPGEKARITGNHSGPLGLVPESGQRNKRSVWSVTTTPFPEAHFATFPPALIEPCILAGCPAGGTVLDPFGGAGTTGLVADRCGRDAILIELNPEYAAMAEKRIRGDSPLFAEVTA